MTTPTPNRLNGKSVYSPMGNDAWRQIWEENRAYFHLDQPNAHLVRNEEHLIAGRQDLTVFFPLCGKAVDMKRFYDLGHQIVGVDCYDKSLEQFFEESGLEYSSKSLPDDGKLYQSADGRIRLYCMDIYGFTGSSLEKDVDGLWDRGSLESINLEDRIKYVKGVLSLASKDVRYLVSATEYDSKEYIGPPYPMFEADMNELFGDSCHVKLLERIDLSDSQSAINKRISKWHRCVYLVTKK